MKEPLRTAMALARLYEQRAITEPWTIEHAHINAQICWLEADCVRCGWPDWRETAARLTAKIPGPESPKLDIPPGNNPAQQMFEFMLLKL